MQINYKLICEQVAQSRSGAHNKKSIGKHYHLLFLLHRAAKRSDYAAWGYAQYFICHKSDLCNLIVPLSFLATTLRLAAKRKPQPPFFTKTYFCNQMLLHYPLAKLFLIGRAVPHLYFLILPCLYSSNVVLANNLIFDNRY